MWPCFSPSLCTKWCVLQQFCWTLQRCHWFWVHNISFFHLTLSNFIFSITGGEDQFIPYVALLKLSLKWQLSHPLKLSIKNTVCAGRRELAEPDVSLKAPKMSRSTLSNLLPFMRSSRTDDMIHASIHTHTHWLLIHPSSQSSYWSLCESPSALACFLTTCSFIITTTLLIVDSSGLTQGQQSNFTSSYRADFIWPRGGSVALGIPHGKTLCHCKRSKNL